MIFLVMLFSIVIAQAQSFIVKTDVLASFFGIYNIEAEYQLSDFQSIDVNVSAISSKTFDEKGGGVAIDYRLYFKQVPKGFYLAPTLGYTLFYEKDTDATFVGIKGGFQYIFGGGNQGVILDVFSGPSYSVSDSVKYTGGSIMIGIKVGYSFVRS